MNNTIVGTVISGNHLGRSFGFPTANLALEHSPSEIVEGVYAAITEYDGRRYKSVVNIGRSPSVIANGGIRIEVHLIGFNGDLYGQQISVMVVKRLRSEQRFASREELVAQIIRDRDRAIEVLSAY
ncbi:MAG: riboflavin kinase [Tidjanibacter sp.]|nr:riboflavin kinase [Tidjanibacter sp.]